MAVPDRISAEKKASYNSTKSQTKNLGRTRKVGGEPDKGRPGRTRNRNFKVGSNSVGANSPWGETGINPSVGNYELNFYRILNDISIKMILNIQHNIFYITRTRAGISRLKKSHENLEGFLECLPNRKSIEPFDRENRKIGITTYHTSVRMSIPRETFLRIGYALVLKHKCCDFPNFRNFACETSMEPIHSGKDCSNILILRLTYLLLGEVFTL